MKSVRLAFLISLGLSLACMAAAFLSLSGWIQIVIGLSIGAQWAFLVWNGRRTYWFSFLGLLALLVYGAALNLPTAWLLGSLVTLLAAWDLGEFTAHLSTFDPDQVSPLLVRNHLNRLLVVAGAGLALGGIALIIKIRLEFGSAVLLGLLVFVGLAGAVRFLRGNL